MVHFKTWAEFHRRNELERADIIARGASESATAKEIVAAALVRYSLDKVAMTRLGRICDKNPFIAEILSLYSARAIPLEPRLSASDLIGLSTAERHRVIGKTESLQNSVSRLESQIALCFDLFYEEDVNGFRSARLCNPSRFVDRVIALLEANISSAVCVRIEASGEPAVLVAGE